MRCMLFIEASEGIFFFLFVFIFLFALVFLFALFVFGYRHDEI